MIFVKVRYKQYIYNIMFFKSTINYLSNLFFIYRPCCSAVVNDIEIR